MYCNKDIKGKKEFGSHVIEEHEFNFLWMHDNNLGGKFVQKELENIKKNQKLFEQEEEEKENQMQMKIDD